MYILECADGSYYTGSTWNLQKRLWEHQNGLGANHTRKRLPVKLVYCEEYDRVEEAYHREKQVQGWSRRKKQALIESNQENLIAYSRNYTQFGKDASLASIPAASTGSAADKPSTEIVENSVVSLNNSCPSTASDSSAADKPSTEPPAKPTSQQ